MESFQSPNAKYSFFGDIAICYTSESFSIVYNIALLLTSHSLTVWSHEPEAISKPSYDIVTYITSFECPTNSIGFYENYNCFFA